MDQLNILQEEVEAIQSLLEKKQEELSRLKRDINQLNTQNISSERSQKTFWSDQNNLPEEFEYQNGSGNVGGQDSDLRKDGAKTCMGTLPKWAIERYSRQILLPEVGVTGQMRLCGGRALIVGAGGLGCPTGAYLAGAGVGEIGIVDYDTVDVTNIHRQFLHGERDQSLSKAESMATSLRSINSRIKVTAYNVQLTSQNAVEIASKYDVVLDCTDNVPTRYLLNDLCVLLKVPLISGSALKMEGQLTVYGYRSKHDSTEKEAYQGPCYRCIFPRPPPAAAVGSCSSNGVIGPVPGAIGSLQALEAIKYLVGQPHSKLMVERMLLFDGEDMTFRTVKLRHCNPQCEVCSDTPTISKLIDYELFCNAQASDKDLELEILPPEHRITASVLSQQLSCEQRHLLVDVRNEAEFRMCRIDGSVNYPIESFEENVDKLAEELKNGFKVTFVCRRGNDSQLAAQKVLEQLDSRLASGVNDLRGGLHAWAESVDTSFPIY